MPFNRWEAKDDYSYAFRLFSKHHTYMNSIYWAHVPATNNVQYQCRKHLKATPIPKTQTAFNLSGKNSHRVADDLKDYSDHLKDFDNWTRLNSLVSVLSYFEIYLSTVVSLAIESDLGLIHSVPKKIDGVMVLKHSSEDSYSFFDKSQLVTKGTWPQRVNHFLALFHLAPISLGSNIAELEKMRKLRNSVAHAFGRDIDKTRSRHTLEILPIERLSEERLMRYMELIMKIAKDIDKQLLERHIGEFELIHFYHNVKADLDPTNPVKSLKTKINGLYVENKSIEYCKELIKLYEYV
ncbi:hypothetical protein DS893_14565 [Vibrionales bacterium C3R12]|nr:hypothetical protein DS893_14565 [Vibrionales bacterium C3R12]